MNLPLYGGSAQYVGWPANTSAIVNFKMDTSFAGKSIVWWPLLQ